MYLTGSEEMKVRLPRLPTDRSPKLHSGFGGPLRPFLVVLLGRET